MPSYGVSAWTIVPLPALVLAVALFPIVAPRAWSRPSLQGAVVAICSTPVVVHLLLERKVHEIVDAATAYASFVATIGALYVLSGGVSLSGDLEGKPSTNVRLVLLGAVLANVLGTTGASLLLVRPLLRANRRRMQRAHLVPMFIITVANVGGLLTPLGDPPLLMGYLGGVPFFWTLRLFPAWLLYVGTATILLYLIERRAYSHEPIAPAAADRAERRGLVLRGKRNVALLVAVVPAMLLPFGIREAAMVSLAAASLAITPRAIHEDNGFSFAPLVHVAVVFAGVFACLGPVEAALARAAPAFRLRESWQLFWTSGLLSSVLDNAPTYRAFAAVARGLSGHGGGLVAGIAPIKLAAVSLGSVVMGATTYLGNAPNLMIKAIAEGERFSTPSFVRHVAFAFAVMAPANLVTTAALALLDR